MNSEFHESTAKTIITNLSSISENLFVIKFTKEQTENPFELIEGRINDFNHTNTPCVIIDLSLFTYINSRLLGLFVSFHKKLQSNNGLLILTIPDPQVMRLLKITRCDNFLSINEKFEDSLEKAKKFINDINKR